MINIFLPLLIICLFIVWWFIHWISILGIGLILFFYWLLFIIGRKSSRQKLNLYKEQIIDHFSSFGTKTGHDHFKYIYDNAHYFLMPMASKGFSSTNSMISIGCLVMGVISVFSSDWYSLGACIIFYLISTTLSAKFNKPYFDLQSVKNEPLDAFDTNYNLSLYWDFFSDIWPELIKQKIQGK